jgi:hypothetical protein
VATHFSAEDDRFRHICVLKRVIWDAATK